MFRFALFSGGSGSAGAIKSSTWPDASEGWC
jgi:hypothetical protein